MNIRIANGVTTVTLTKTEQATLRKAHDICAALSLYESAEARDALAELVDKHCTDTKPEPATP